MEEWKKVKGYEGLYEVSNLGRIKSIQRKVKSRNGRNRPLAERILKQMKDTHGYNIVSLSKDGIRKTFNTHTLVARSFIGSKPDGLVVDHRDNDKSNNSHSNLRYITQRQNAYRGYKKSRNVYKVDIGYRVQFRIEGKIKYFGHYKTEEEGIERAKEVRQEYGIQPLIK